MTSSAPRPTSPSPASWPSSSTRARSACSRPRWPRPATSPPGRWPAPSSCCAYDLLWSRMVGEYLMGERAPMNDLMAWNADTTRMPARMHSQYLRQLFLNDDLSEGRYLVGGRPISCPTRHPELLRRHRHRPRGAWRSVHKLHYLTSVELRFVLTSGGHNAGIVSEPGQPHRHFQALDRPATKTTLPPDDWLPAPPPRGLLVARTGRPGCRPTPAPRWPRPMGTASHPALGDARHHVLENSPPAEHLKAPPCVTSSSPSRPSSPGSPSCGCRPSPSSGALALLHAARGDDELHGHPRHRRDERRHAAGPAPGARRALAGRPRQGLPAAQVAGHQPGW